MEEARRQLEPELALQPIPDSTREHAHPRTQSASRAHDLYARRVRVEALRPEPGPDLDAGALGGKGELAIELAAVDDRDPLPAGAEREDPPARRVDQAGRRTAEHQALRNLEEIGDLVRDDPGAVSGLPERGVLLEEDDVEALLGQEQSGVEARWAPAHHDDVEHEVRILSESTQVPSGNRRMPDLIGWFRSVPVVSFEVSTKPGYSLAPV